MKCPFCGHPEDRVIDSRASQTGDVIRRRRECESCDKRFTTYERVEYALPTVVKKDGRREPFDRSKIVQSLRVALSKRPVSAERIEAIADQIERELVDADAREIVTSQIGERVMARLRSLDEVAYVRFASVYRSFRDIDEFAAELSSMAGRMSEQPEPATPESSGPAPATIREETPAAQQPALAERESEGVS